MRIPLVFALLVLSACAPSFAPPLDGGVTPTVAEDAILARDGTRLPLRRWEAEGKVRAVIIGLHGMSDYSNAFDMPAKVWARLGITTIAYDQRGFGLSATPGIWAGAEAMRSDLNDTIAAARARYPGVPVFALGESMGGAVVLTAIASANPPAADGIILVAPAVWSRGDMPMTYRVALFLAAHFLPGLVLSNSAASHVVTIYPSDNFDMLRAMGRDSLVQHQTRADAVFGLTNLMDEARTGPSRLAGPPPILFTYGAKDQVIPAAPTQAVIAALGARAEVHHYEAGYHMLLRDLGRAQPQKDIANWVLREPATKASP